MNYEIVNLTEKTVVGIKARTNNAAPDMGTVIGSLWNRFFQDGIYMAIQHKTNAKTLGIYTDYVGNENDDYSVIVACEVESADAVPNGAVVRKIPSGRYAKFVVEGPMQAAIVEFWKQIWAMDLPRSYVCDFEEYQNANPENAVIHIYIGLKNE